MGDGGWLDGLTSMIQVELEKDWARLSGDPRAAAEVAARRVGPMIYGQGYDDEIRGAPWGSAR